MNFENLVSSIQITSAQLQQNAVKAVNINLTMRNWLVGFYIVEFEQNGDDRAVYGSNLINKLAEQIKIKGLTSPELSRCRQFYKTYPQILGLATQEFKNLIPAQIGQKLTDEFKSIINDAKPIGQLPTDQLNNPDIESYIPQTDHYLNKLLISISFTHFVELIKIDDITKRRFYELLILKTTPSVKELQRQIQALSYERLGLSKNKEIAFGQLREKITPEKATDIIKSHYFFEFLNINQPHLIEENDLEQALIDHLQQFMLELGNGFCFEARQKRLLMGDEYFFIDLVFYHRILKCHVLVELKTEKANHEHIGQLKTYINYYKKNLILPNDNPPVGILLVTDQNKTLVEYAIADSDRDIFVSKYLLQLPDKQQIASFIDQELKNL